LDGHHGDSDSDSDSDSNNSNSNSNDNGDNDDDDDDDDDDLHSYMTRPLRLSLLTWAISTRGPRVQSADDLNTKTDTRNSARA
jgi:hypothetical protein